MDGWIQFCGEIDLNGSNIESLKHLACSNSKEYSVYPNSINFAGGSCFFVAIARGGKTLVIYGKGEHYDKFDGQQLDVNNNTAKLCSLSNHNCDSLRRVFPFTNPVSHKKSNITIGLGDRLGLASPGHLRLISNKDVFPVLAQQSMRELNLTGRTYHDVLSAAAWSVFQEGYKKGFGADGDHLKKPEEIKMALDYGFTMITLDCSEHIDNSAATLSPEDIEKKYSALPYAEQKRLEAKYAGKTFKLKSGAKVCFSLPELKKIVLVYLKAVNYTIELYNSILKDYRRDIDFEMSIDETLTSTTPESHFFVASELTSCGVEITSLAPRFCGEFQKGIDYRGDISQFEAEFSMHVKIAEHFGYKISVHSGSDKFTVFPAIGRETKGRYHLKTAGTNWLEAVRVIAVKNPSLYRKMHKFALSHLDEAKKYYHISADTAKVPDIDKLNDKDLPALMDLDDSRQVLHITYGLILMAKAADGSSSFRDDIYSTLDSNENDYYTSLEKHIGRHLKELGIN